MKLYFSRNFRTFSVFVLLKDFADGSLENLSTEVSICCSRPFSFVTGPQKSNWISSFGSRSRGSGACLFFGVIGFKFLPIFVQAFACLRFVYQVALHSGPKSMF